MTTPAEWRAAVMAPWIDEGNVIDRDHPEETNPATDRGRSWIGPDSAADTASTFLGDAPAAASDLTNTRSTQPT
jgi:hypothetical protein